MTFSHSTTADSGGLHKYLTDYAGLDIRIGNHLKVTRGFMRVSQKTLARASGISYQHLQKHESGEARFGVARLFRLSDGLNLSILEFIPDVGKRPLLDVQPKILESLLDGIPPDLRKVVIRKVKKWEEAA